MTSPPNYLTESELITIMENYKIGIDSSMALYIDSILQRNYITVTTDRRLKPTSRGIILVHGYQKVNLTYKYNLIKVLVKGRKIIMSNDYLILIIAIIYKKSLKLLVFL